MISRYRRRSRYIFRVSPLSSSIVSNWLRFRCWDSSHQVERRGSAAAKEDEHEPGSVGRSLSNDLPLTA